jgi:hypothetical protein
MGSNNSGRQTESALKTQALNSQTTANAAIEKAETPDPFEARRRAYVNKVLDWNEGVGGPPDVRDFPDKSAMALYTDAKRVTDEGRVGKGYGTLADGGNDTYASALGKELESERSLEASGRLEEHVNNAITGAQAEAGNWAGVGNARNMSIAGMRNSNANADQDRWLQYLSRPKPPSFLKQLALGGVSGLSVGGGGAGGALKWAI